MYHYRECGLPNICLLNGYRTLETEYGEAVSIEDVEGLHAAMCQTLVEEKPSPLTGAEVRFIRKYLDLTQASLADFLGLKEQSVRLWESRGNEREVPSSADRMVRMACRDITRVYSKPLEELSRIISTQRQTQRIDYSFTSGVNAHWNHQLITA
ncbi:MAG: hypothetical protein LC637_04455 [Xanthomonadaceae bacterium]|nr:hypothetical protein [Xanthomonadaceae bacterium]